MQVFHYEDHIHRKNLDPRELTLLPQPRSALGAVTPLRLAYLGDGEWASIEPSAARLCICLAQQQTRLHAEKALELSGGGRASALDSLCPPLDLRTTRTIYHSRVARMNTAGLILLAENASLDWVEEPLRRLIRSVVVLPRDVLAVVAPAGAMTGLTPTLRGLPV